MVSFEDIFGLTSIMFWGIAHKFIKLPYLAEVNVYITVTCKIFPMFKSWSRCTHNRVTG